MDILAEIHKRKVRSLQASYNYSEAREKALSRKAENVQRRLANGEIKIDEHTLYSLYTRLLDKYHHGTRMNLPTSLNARGRAVWGRALARCEEAGVDPETFMMAQFRFFHKAFGKPPEPKHFTTENAVARAQEYASGEKVTSVTTGALLHKTEFADMMRWADKQVRDLCKSHGFTREELYLNIIIPGELSLPQAFLDADPVYKRALEKVGR